MEDKEQIAYIAGWVEALTTVGLLANLTDEIALATIYYNQWKEEES